MTVDPKQLVRYVVWQARQLDTAVTETRLIKYLYLIDLYHARLNNGQTLTGWQWKFVHFGPYCSEAYSAVEDAVKHGFIEESFYDSQYEDRDRFRLLSIDEEEAEEEPILASKLHIGIISPLQSVIKKFGDDTAALLDYVYFDTEPMRGARPYQELDFKLARKPEMLPAIKMKKLSPAALQRGAGIIEKLKKKYKDAVSDSEKRSKKRARSGLYDEEYEKAMQYLNAGDLKTGLKGVAKVEP